jgi:ribosomal protein S27AE
MTPWHWVIAAAAALAMFLAGVAVGELTAPGEAEKRAPGIACAHRERVFGPVVGDIAYISRGQRVAVGDVLGWICSRCGARGQASGDEITRAGAVYDPALYERLVAARMSDARSESPATFRREFCPVCGEVTVLGSQVHRCRAGSVH